MNPLMAPESFAPGRTGTALSVNVNRIALLRNSRPVGLPDVVKLAERVLEAGADGITVHPRPDARHITSADVHALATLLKRWPQADYNIEGNPFHNLMPLVREVRPQQVTLVPDSADQATSDHGWNLALDAERLRPVINELKALGLRVSLFMDPDPAAMAAAAALGADRVELYTEAYAQAWADPRQRAQSLQRYALAAHAAQAAGLGVNAGHDLNRDNLADFLRGVPGVHEVSIGHALIADALELGMAATVHAYQACIRAAQTPCASSQAAQAPSASIQAAQAPSASIQAAQTPGAL